MSQLETLVSTNARYQRCQKSVVGLTWLLWFLRLLDWYWKTYISSPKVQIFGDPDIYLQEGSSLQIQSEISQTIVPAKMRRHLLTTLCLPLTKYNIPARATKITFTLTSLANTSLARLTTESVLPTSLLPSYVGPPFAVRPYFACLSVYHSSNHPFFVRLFFIHTSVVCLFVPVHSTVCA